MHLLLTLDAIFTSQINIFKIYYIVLQKIKYTYNKIYRR